MVLLMALQVVMVTVHGIIGFHSFRIRAASPISCLQVAVITATSLTSFFTDSARLLLNVVIVYW